MIPMCLGGPLHVAILQVGATYMKDNACHSLLGVAERLQHTWRIHYIIHFSPTHGHLLNLLATPATLCKGWQSGSNIHGGSLTPA